MRAFQQKNPFTISLPDPGVAQAFDAGWSSPVARQAHNLKVIGSNPIPATKHQNARQARPARAFLRLGALGSADKFEPVSGGGKMDHAEEAVGELVVAGGDGAVDLELSENI